MLNYFRCLNLDKIDALADQIENEKVVLSEGGWIEMIVSDNWRDQIVGVVLSFLYPSEKGISYLWRAYEKGGFVNDRVIGVLSMLDSEFDDKAKSDVYSLIDRRSLSEMAVFHANNSGFQISWLNKNEIALIYLYNKKASDSMVDFYLNELVDKDFGAKNSIKSLGRWLNSLVMLSEKVGSKM